jgi:hypothetical protein
MPVMKSKSVVKPKSKPKPKSVSKGGVSNKVAPYNPSISQRTERKSSQNLVVSVIKNLLNKSNSKVAAEKPRFGYSSNKK